MDKKTFLSHMLNEGKIDQIRYDKGIIKITEEEQEKIDYKENKSKMTDKQRLDRIEKILGL